MWDEVVDDLLDGGSATIAPGRGYRATMSTAARSGRVVAPDRASAASRRAGAWAGASALLFATHRRVDGEAAAFARIESDDDRSAACSTSSRASASAAAGSSPAPGWADAVGAGPPPAPRPGDVVEADDVSDDLRAAAATSGGLCRRGHGPPRDRSRRRRRPPWALAGLLVDPRVIHRGSWRPALEAVAGGRTDALGARPRCVGASSPYPPGHGARAASCSASRRSTAARPRAAPRRRRTARRSTGGAAPRAVGGGARAQGRPLWRVRLWRAARAAARPSCGRPPIRRRSRTTAELPPDSAERGALSRASARHARGGRARCCSSASSARACRSATATCATSSTRGRCRPARDRAGARGAARARRGHVWRSTRRSRPSTASSRRSSSARTPAHRPLRGAPRLDAERHHDGLDGASGVAAAGVVRPRQRGQR